MSEINPAVERYLSRFAVALAAVPDQERCEMVREIRSHIAEALYAGRDAAEVLERLGPADRLAAAYRAELLLNHRPSGAGTVAWQFGLLSALGGASLVSLFVITVLALLALSFIVSGLAVFLAGVGLPLVPASQLSSPLTMGESRVVMIVVGAVSLALGAASAAGLWVYLKFASRAVQHLLERIRTHTLTETA